MVGECVNKFAIQHNRFLTGKYLQCITSANCLSSTDRARDLYSDVYAHYAYAKNV